MTDELEVMLERRVLVSVLHLLRDRPLSELLDLVDKRGTRNGLANVTLNELAHCQCRSLVKARRLAEASHGPAYDALVLRVLLEADGHFVPTSSLHARVGGPRWKLRSSLARLEKQGYVSHFGATCDRKYAAIWTLVFICFAL